MADYLKPDSRSEIRLDVAIIELTASQILRGKIGREILFRNGN